MLPQMTMTEARFLTPLNTSNKTILALKDLPDEFMGNALRLHVCIVFSSVFLTVKKSAQGSSLLFAQKKLLLNNNP